MKCNVCLTLDSELVYEAKMRDIKLSFLFNEYLKTVFDKPLTNELKLSNNKKELELNLLNKQTELIKIKEHLNKINEAARKKDKKIISSEVF